MNRRTAIVSVAASLAGPAIVTRAPIILPEIRAQQAEVLSGFRGYEPTFREVVIACSPDCWARLRADRPDLARCTEIRFDFGVVAIASMDYGFNPEVSKRWLADQIAQSQATRGFLPHPMYQTVQVVEL